MLLDLSFFQLFLDKVSVFSLFILMLQRRKEQGTERKWHEEEHEEEYNEIYNIYDSDYYNPKQYNPTWVGRVGAAFRFSYTKKNNQNAKMQHIRGFQDLRAS